MTYNNLDDITKELNIRFKPSDYESDNEKTILSIFNGTANFKDLETKQQYMVYIAVYYIKIKNDIDAAAKIYEELAQNKSYIIAAVYLVNYFMIKKNNQKLIIYLNMVLRNGSHAQCYTVCDYLEKDKSICSILIYAYIQIIARGFRGKREYVNLINIYFNNGYNSEIIELYELSIKFKINIDESIPEISKAYYYLGNINKCVSLLQKGAKLKIPLSFLYLGDIYNFELNNYIDACILYIIEYIYNPSDLLDNIILNKFIKNYNLYRALKLIAEDESVDISNTNYTQKNIKQVAKELFDKHINLKLYLGDKVFETNEQCMYCKTCDCSTRIKFNCSLNPPHNVCMQCYNTIIHANNKCLFCK